MATLVLENVPQDVYERLEQLAVAGQRTIADEAVRLLQESLQGEEARRHQAEVLAALRRQSWLPPPGTPDTVELVREDRDR